MDKTCRLMAIAWIYCLIGVYALVDQVVSLFRPLDDPLIHLFVLWPDVNLAILMLPIGIGLMRRSNLSRRFAIVLSWATAGFLVVALGLLALGVLGDKTFWMRPAGPVTGEYWSRVIGLIVIGVPIFVWQLWQLHSREIRGLTESS